MVAVQIRKQGGASVISIPSWILKTLHLSAGSMLNIDLKEGAFVVSPQKKSQRNRYSLEQLLAGNMSEHSEAMLQETAWAREGIQVGRELT